MSLRNAGPVTLAYDGHSDADSTHRPSDSRWQKCSPDWVRKVYLAKLAQKYMEDTNRAEAGKGQPFCFGRFLLMPLLLPSSRMPVIFLLRRVSRGFFWAKMLVYFHYCTFQSTKNCCPGLFI